MILMASKERRGAVVFSYVKKVPASSSKFLSNHFKRIKDSKELSRGENIAKKN
jgi:hypothetical protein